MFSRLALQRGLAAVKDGPKQMQPLLAAGFHAHTNTKDTKRTQEIIDLWDEKNKMYFGPERDTVNFPHPLKLEYHEDVRLGFIPKSWFDAFYSKTGVAGPYVALTGMTTFLLSKEFWVNDHGMYEFITFWPAVYIIVKFGGPAISKFYEGIAVKMEDKMHKPLEKSRVAFQEAVSKIDAQVDQEQRHKYVYELQKENVDLQMEARYRERVAQVYSAVKRRLDYQVELVNTKKRLEQQHMVNWIVDSVVKGITPKQEKDAITSCIANLKALAKTNPAV